MIALSAEEHSSEHYEIGEKFMQEFEERHNEFLSATCVEWKNMTDTVIKLLLFK